jgi:hypothetical protein
MCLIPSEHSLRLFRRVILFGASGCGPVRQGTCMGCRGSSVRIRPPRPENKILSLPQSLKGKDFLCLISFLLFRLRAIVRVRTSLGGRPGGGRGASGTFDPARLWAGR